MKAKFPHALDVIPWIKGIEDAQPKAGFDAIPGARFYLLPFDPPAGHFSASSQSPLGVELINKTVSGFLAENHL
jgi:hypothetical protein